MLGFMCVVGLDGCSEESVLAASINENGVRSCLQCEANASDLFQLWYCPLADSTF